MPDWIMATKISVPFSAQAAKAMPPAAARSVRPVRYLIAVGSNLVDGVIS